MKKNSLKIFAAIGFLIPCLAQAQNSYDINLVNHFDKAIAFTVGINPDVLPNLPKNFVLAPNGQIHANVVDIKKEAYIGGNAGQHENVFFGVEIENNKIKFHGYIGKNIAYSWNNNTVTFCTPSEYSKKKSC